MTDITNILQPFTCYTASTFHTTQATVARPVTNAWNVPADTVLQSVGVEAQRMFRTDTFIDPFYGQIIFSWWLTKATGALVNDHMIFDVGLTGSGGGNSNTAYGGYGCQITSGATPALEFLWRDEGDTGDGAVLLSQVIDDIGDAVLFPPSGTKHPNGPPGTTDFDWHMGVVLNFLPEGNFVDLWAEGSLIKSDFLPAGEQVSVNPGAGIMLWGANRDFNDGAALTKVMNTGAGVDATFRQSSFFAQRLETDRSEKAAQIMRDAVLTRQSQPVTSESI